MRLILSTLTPVHIGSGTSYSPSEFLITDKKLHRVDINKLFTILDEKSREELITHLEDPFFQLGSFLKDKNVQISDIKLYSCDLRSGLPNEVNEHIKTNGKAFIPGSTIKGSIRTAILYNLFEEKDVYKISKILELKYWKRTREIQNLIDGYFSGSDRSSSYTSFMRFIQISDTNTIKEVSINAINVLEAEKSGWTWYKRRNRNVILFNETIDEKKEFNFEMKENYEPTIYKDLRLGKKEEVIDLNKIMELIYNFSSDLIKHEMEFSKKYNIEFLSDFYRRLKSENSIKSPVLRLGQGSGYLSTTIGLKLKKYPHIFEKVRKSTRGKSYPYEFPKSRKIVVENGKPIHSLGWVKLRGENS